MCEADVWVENIEKYKLFFFIFFIFFLNCYGILWIHVK